MEKDLSFIAILQKHSDYYIEKYLLFPMQMSYKDYPIVREAIQTRINEISLQTLLHEFEIYRSNQRAKGKCHVLSTFYSSFEANKIKNDYPVLDTIIKREIISLNDYMQEIFDNFEKIKKKYSFNKIEGMTLSMGDRHNNGRFVCLLTIDGEEWIYKPRGGEIDKRFHTYIKSKLPNYSFIVHSEEYFSFHKKVEWNACSEEKQIEQVFFEIGYISAIFYFLSATDMHYENMIVSEEHPYFIDLETITDVASGSLTSLCTEVLSKSTSNVLHLISDSVLNSNIFPYSLDGKEMDISALFGKGQNLDNFYYNSYRLESVNTDDVRLVEVSPKISDEKNQVVFKGETVNILDYYSTIIKGFTQLCNEVLSDKLKVESELVSIIYGLEIRQVLRATHLYYHFLTTSYGPYYLTDNLKRDKLFSILDEPSNYLNNEYGAGEKNTEEIKILKTDNIPIFYCQSNSKDLYSSNGLVISDFFGESPIEKIQRKVRAFSEKELNFQVSLLESSLFIGLSNSYIKDEKIETENQKWRAEEIVTDFLKTLIEKNNEIYSIIPSEFGEKYVLTSMNTSIYESGGVILTLLYMADQFKLDKIFFKKIIRGIDGQKLYFSDLLSGFSGIGSYIYINLLLWNKFSDYEFKENVIQKTKMIVSSLDSIDEDKVSIDFINGLSSLLVVLQEIYIQKEFPLNFCQLKQVISRISYLIISRSKEEKINNFGFAHGLSGIMFGLAKANIILQDEFISQSIIYFLEIEERAYCEEYGNYFDDKNKCYSSYYYCYGLPGILLSRIKLMETGIEVNTEKMVKRIIAYSNKIITNQITFSDYSLCHGIGGSIELFEEAYRMHFISKDKYQEVMDCLFSMKCSSNGLKLPVKFQNFMLGEWSIVYRKLRMEENIPSFLFLDTIA